MNKEILFLEPHSLTKPIVSIYKNTFNSFYKTQGIKKVLIEIVKINKNVFLTDIQKKQIKKYVQKCMRIRMILIKFCTKLIYKARNKRKSINEYTLDFQTNVADLSPNEKVCIYNGLNKWTFTCHEINRLFLSGIHNSDMVESLPLLMSNPYSGELVQKNVAMHIYYQLKMNNYRPHHLVELLSKEYFCVIRFKMVNYFLLQRETVNRYINSASKRDLLEILESIKKESVAARNVLDINPLVESLLRTVAKRELLNIPTRFKDYSATCFYADDITIDRNKIPKKSQGALARKREERQVRRRRQQRLRRQSLTRPTATPSTFTELEINREIENGINETEVEKEFEFDLEQSLGDLTEAATALQELFINGISMSIPDIPRSTEENEIDEFSYFVDWGHLT